MSMSTLLSGLMGNRYIVIGLVAVLLLGVGYVVYTQYFRSSTVYNANRENMQNESDASSASKTATMMLFYADWCPHCVKAKPEWNDLKDEFTGKKINGYKMNFVEYNCSSTDGENADIAAKYNVNGFPTFKMVKDNQVFTYDLNGPPTKASLENFLNSTLFGG